MNRPPVDHGPRPTSPGGRPRNPHGAILPRAMPSQRFISMWLSTAAACMVFGVPQEAPRRANRLAAEKSPYLLQHSRNPVDWYPWGDEALARARAENKPIFLSIGYSTCYWCHVMERECFENE